jgi:outer membrane lipase/esterase
MRHEMNQESNVASPAGSRARNLTRQLTTSVPGMAAIVLLTSALAPARAQTFTNLWVFGDSFADQGNAENLLTHSGAPYPSHVPGPILYHTYPFWLQAMYNIPSAQYFNYAIDGATSTTVHILQNKPSLFGFTTEVAKFSASQQPILPSNLVTISIGINDPGVYGVLLTPAQDAAQATFDVTRAAQTLIAAGGRTFAIAGFSNDSVFPELQHAAADPAYLAQYSGDYYQGLQTALASLSRPGVRFFLFDESRMFEQVNANPSAYGFINTTVFCDQVPGCARQPDSPLQFQYLSYDGLHFTSGGFALQARYMANQLAAPNGIPAETSLAQIGAASFANAIFDRLNGNRGQNVMPGSPYAAATPGSPWSLYLQGLGSFGHRDSRFGATGFDYSDGGVIFGAEYNISPDLLLGLGFNYSSPSASLQGGSGNIGLNQYQLAVYASYTGRHLFTDAIVSGGHDGFSVTRPGIISTITASPDGQSYVAGFDSGYLFDMVGFRIGPIIGLTYVDSHAGAYTESGDPLITQSVAGQHENSLNGNAGLQARVPVSFPSGVVVSPYVDLTAERDFLGNSRVLSTAFTAAPALPIYSIVAGSGTGTYGRLSGGLSGNLAPNLSAAIQGELTFARPGGNDFGFTANLAYRF